MHGLKELQEQFDGYNAKPALLQGKIQLLLQTLDANKAFISHTIYSVLSSLQQSQTTQEVQYRRVSDSVLGTAIQDRILAAIADHKHAPFCRNNTISNNIKCFIDPSLKNNTDIPTNDTLLFETLTKLNVGFAAASLDKNSIHDLSEAYLLLKDANPTNRDVVKFKQNIIETLCKKVKIKGKSQESLGPILSKHLTDPSSTPLSIKEHKDLIFLGLNQILPLLEEKVTFADGEKEQWAKALGTKFTARNPLSVELIESLPPIDVSTI